MLQLAAALLLYQHHSILGWPRKFRETKFRGISCYFYFVFSRKFRESFRGISRNFVSRKCSYFVTFRGIPLIWFKLSERKLVPVWGQESRWSVWRLLPPLPELTEVMLGGIGEGGVCGLAWNQFFPVLIFSFFSLIMACTNILTHNAVQFCCVNNFKIISREFFFSVRCVSLNNAGRFCSSIGTITWHTKSHILII